MSDQPLRVLYVCHNHPSVRPGGAEGYALELHRAMAERDEVRSTFIAKGGPPLSPIGQLHPGTLVSPVGERSDEYFFFTDGYEFDWLYGSVRGGKDLYTKHFRDFLLATRPDVVHFHHTLFLGYDLLRVTRDVLPSAPIIYTLHEFLPICHRQGQMVRTVDERPCMEESPRRCHECFPDISPQDFFLRKRLVRSHFRLVDLFIAPSRFLMERYLDWGIPADRIREEEYGRAIAVEPIRDAREPRTRFGFFGQLNPYKGVVTVLEAMRRLDAKNRPAASLTLRVHGANLDLQPGPFQNQVNELLQATRETVTFVGRYDPGQVRELMGQIDWAIVPSTWWENSPLVIQEAFAHGRPILASDIGGMAEKVRDGVDGLHFRAGDPDSLVESMIRAATTPGLWERLRDGIQPVYRMEEHVNELLRIYRELADRRAVEKGSLSSTAR